jgi:hypothetical protein
MDLTCGSSAGTLLHQSPIISTETAVAGRAADVDEKIAVQVAVACDFERRIAQIDGAVEKATSKGRTGLARAARRRSAPEPGRAG